MASVGAISVSSGTDRWLSLVSVVEKLSAAESLREVIRIVRDTARTISGADGVSFILRDEGYCHYIEEDAVGPLWKGRRFPLTACVSGWCMLNGKTAVIPDVYVDPRIPYDAYRPTFVKSLVMVPVRAENPLAAIGSYWNVCRTFSDAEVALLEALARSTAAAIATVQARDTLRDNEERLRLALTAGHLGAWELNLASHALTASAVCKATFGRDADEPLSYEDFVSAIHPEDRRRLERAFEEALKGRTDLNTEFRIVRPNGTVRWVQMRGRLIHDTDVGLSRMTGVSLDITAQREAKDRVEGLQSELAHVGRLTELGQMSASFAHELVQPLAAAKNYLGVARRRVHADVPALDAIARAEAQMARAIQTIQRIKGFAGKALAVQDAEDVTVLVEEAIEIAHIDPKCRNIDLQLAIEPDIPPVLVDRVQIQQVLLNLLRNACEALEDAELKEVRVTASQVDNGAMVELQVQDSGPGFTPEVAAGLFKAFHTTKANGMGVGLTICRQIVEGHGGKIWARSNPGRGATFCFTVPTAVPRAALTEARARLPEAAD